MKRLNRWQRTGIVLSVVWAIGGGTWGWRHAEDQITEDFKACIRAIENSIRLTSLPRDTVPRSHCS